MPGPCSLQARALYVLGKYPEAEKLYKPALAIFEKARPSAATTRDLAKTLNGLGRVYEHEGRYARLDRATPPARRHSSKPTFSKRTTSLQESTTQ
jgi:tetratricopeptide (TPR) repeat protein